MIKVNSYIERSAFKAKSIDNKVPTDLALIVVIPCYNEPNLLATLNALMSCDRTNGSVEVIVSINASETSTEDVIQSNEKNLKLVADFQNKNDFPWISFYAINSNDLPKKHAGVGLGRKIGMDEAVRRFDSIDKDGGIVCFDADSLCSSNYLIDLEKAFSDKKVNTVGIAFEHPLTGEFSDEIYQAIAEYELFLRYYALSLKYTGFPYHYHTIGSSMAARSSVYQKQGGMNRRKAGEDFYFLQKLFPLGGFVELKTCRVIPSPRQSDRVPFGTGKAVNDILSKEESGYPTYPVEMFDWIKVLIDLAPDFYLNNEEQIGEKLDILNEGVQRFLLENDFIKSVLESSRQSPNKERFVYRFFEYLNAFRLLKLVHFLRDEYTGSSDLVLNANSLLKKLGKDLELNNAKELLLAFREIEYD